VAAPSINACKSRLVYISGTICGWAFSWTSLLSPRPYCLDYLPARLHKVNHICCCLVFGTAVYHHRQVRQIKLAVLAFGRSKLSTELSPSDINAY